MEHKEFAQRLAELRMNKGVSARDMSLSLGQSEGYINKIENGTAFPSMTVFFYICEYLEITPAEFFEEENTNPQKLNELIKQLKDMSSSQLDSIISITKEIKK